MLNAIHAAKDFSDLKFAVTLFVARIDYVLGDEDLLDLAASAVLDREKSVKDGLTLFNLALTHEQHERELFGETVSK
jgi:hypothetical protein